MPKTAIISNNGIVSKREGFNVPPDTV